MGGPGFAMGLAQGLQSGQDRLIQMQQLKLQQDYAKSRQKQMEIEDQLHQMQVDSFMKRMAAEERVPGLQAGVLGDFGAAPLGQGEQGPMPEAPPEIDRRKLLSLLQTAQQAGQDPMHLLQLMSLADPRIKAISDSLMPEKFIKVGEGEEVISEKTKQPIAKGRPKAHVLAPGATLFREGEEAVQAPPQPEKPLVVPPGASVLPPGQTQPSFTAPQTPQRPMSVAPGGTVVNPETGQPIFTAPESAKPMSVPQGGTVINPQTGQTIFTAPEPQQKPMNVPAGSTVYDPKTGMTVFTAPPAQKVVDFGDRLESAAAAYLKTVHGLDNGTFTDLLRIDPMGAQKIRQQAMVDEPAIIQAGKIEASIPAKQKELLSPEEANKLGVPYGTTKGEAKGIMPITSEQRQNLASYDTARVIIGDIEQYSLKVNKAAGGLMGRTKQTMKLWGAWTQSDPDAALLQSKAGELATIARSLGEKGALANQDVARAAALIPSVLDTQDVAIKKLIDMNKIINEGEANYRKSLGIDARKAPPPSKQKTPIEVPAPLADPLAAIPVPPGLTPQQAEVYRKAYAAERQKKQQQMRPSNAGAQ